MPWRRGTWRSGAARRRPPCWSAAGPRCAVSWTTRPCKPVLLQADTVVVVRDNERTEQRQAETDAAHDRQIARIRELRGTCADWRPPVGVKDVAELNQRERAGAGALGPGSFPAGNEPRRAVMSASRIEWTEQTWNPVTGCTKISPGCQHCYAERMALRLQAMDAPGYARGFALTLHEDRLDQPLGRKKPTVYFVGSMADLFHETCPTPSWIACWR